MKKNDESGLISREKSIILTPDGCTDQEERLARETPYSITLNDEVIGSTMVLPVALEELGVGFLFGQGYLQKPEEIKEVVVCPDGRIAVYGSVEAGKVKEVVITSGCGGTGKIAKEMFEDVLEPLCETTITFTEIGAFIRQSLQASALSNDTHCVHGCSLWEDGELKLFYEDVGRHNAVDKVLGAILLGKASPKSAVYTTGRLTSDMVLKCARMGIPIIISRSAPSSLGLAIARKTGVTLIGYARPRRLNVFNGQERIIC